jgi:phosphoribosylformylglycinamidine synthase
MTFGIEVTVMLKEGISDPQGQILEKTLPALGFKGVAGVRVGKRIAFDIEASTEQEARDAAEEMCRALLANPVIESFEVSVV